MSERRVPPWLVGLCLALVAGLCGSGFVTDRHARPYALHAATLALGPGGAVVDVQDRAALVPGTRVLAGTPDTAALVREQRDWLAAGTVPGVPELGHSTMLRDALLDLHVLGRPYGVAVAGWSGPWRYVWPRDSALVAAALARTGHPADAERVLAFLGQVQPADGVFAARYRPDLSGVPDDRGEQLDGTGWTLWALDQVAAELPAAERQQLLARHRGLLDSSTDAALRLTAGGTRLPPVSPDYWEVRETRPTLATAALLRAGLESAGRLYAGLDDPRSGAARAAAEELGQVIDQEFGPDGYPRHPGGSADSVDLGVGFLLPPFTAAPLPGGARPVAVAAVGRATGSGLAHGERERAWRNAPTHLRRPGGGLAPGGSWRPDGISWTTATSSYALTAAAAGDRAEALRWLTWLDAHRTAAGSLPEKVTPEGRPAAVAPLAWAAAATLLAADELAR